MGQWGKGREREVSGPQNPPLGWSGTVSWTLQAVREPDNRNCSVSAKEIQGVVNNNCPPKTHPGPYGLTAEPCQILQGEKSKKEHAFETAVPRKLEIRGHFQARQGVSVHPDLKTRQGQRGKEEQNIPRGPGGKDKPEPSRTQPVLNSVSFFLGGGVTPAVFWAGGCFWMPRQCSQNSPGPHLTILGQCSGTHEVANWSPEPLACSKESDP